MPFSFSTLRRDKPSYNARTTQTSSYAESKNLALRYCQRCGGEIIEPIAVYCYHCGEKLNNK
ncbi:MAG: hypothetical protein ACFFCY_07820 [Promethearchaeota archaeon]